MLLAALPYLDEVRALCRAKQEWTAWDFRAYMEKRRQHERQYADYVRRQNAVGQNDYLNVSAFSDHRILTNYIDQTGELPSRSTHEEFMDVRVMPMSSTKSSCPRFANPFFIYSPHEFVHALASLLAMYSLWARVVTCGAAADHQQRPLSAPERCEHP